MNKTLTVVISASLGGAIGAGVTYLTLRKKFERKINEEVQAFKAAYHPQGAVNTPKDPSKIVVYEVSDISEETLDKVDTMIENLDYAPEGVGPGMSPGPRSTVILNDEDGTADDIREAPEEVRQELLEEALDPGNQVPFVISVEEFQYDMDYYSKNTITYYDKCGTLVDESDRPIDDVNYCIGDDSLDKFGVSSQDPNIVYIRNDRISTDFEVIRHPGSYVNTVFGIQDDAHDPVERKNKRPKFRDDN